MSLHNIVNIHVSVSGRWSQRKDKGIVSLSSFSSSLCTEVPFVFIQPAFRKQFLTVSNSPPTSRFVDPTLPTKTVNDPPARHTTSAQILFQIKNSSSLKVVSPKYRGEKKGKHGEKQANCLTCFLFSLLFRGKKMTPLKKGCFALPFISTNLHSSYPC